MQLHTNNIMNLYIKDYKSEDEFILNNDWVGISFVDDSIAQIYVSKKRDYIIGIFMGCYYAFVVDGKVIQITHQMYPSALFDLIKIDDLKRYARLYQDVIKTKDKEVF